MSPTRQWWKEARPTKTVWFWSCVGSAVVTVIIGFAGGGWVTAATARNMGEKMADDAVVTHMAPLCVARVNKDPMKGKKLEELKGLAPYERDEFVEQQGWARLPGGAEADLRIVDKCARLISPPPKITPDPASDRGPDGERSARPPVFLAPTTWRW